MGKDVGSKIYEEMLKAFPNSKIIHIPILYVKEVRDYCIEIERAHEKAGKSNNNTRFYSLVN